MQRENLEEQLARCASKENDSNYCACQKRKLGMQVKSLQRLPKKQKNCYCTKIKNTSSFAENLLVTDKIS